MLQSAVCSTVTSLAVQRNNLRVGVKSRANCSSTVSSDAGWLTKDKQPQCAATPLPSRPVTTGPSDQTDLSCHAGPCSILSLSALQTSIKYVTYSLCTVLNWEHIVTAQCDGPPQVAWRALKILVVFTTTFKREGTCPMKVKQNIAWYV